MDSVTETQQAQASIFIFAPGGREESKMRDMWKVLWIPSDNLLPKGARAFASPCTHANGRRESFILNAR